MPAIQFYNVGAGGLRTLGSGSPVSCGSVIIAALAAGGGEGSGASGLREVGDDETNIFFVSKHGLGVRPL